MICPNTQCRWSLGLFGFAIGLLACGTVVAAVDAVTVNGHALTAGSCALRESKWPCAVAGGRRMFLTVDSKMTGLQATWTELMYGNIRIKGK